MMKHRFHRALALQLTALAVVAACLPACGEDATGPADSSAATDTAATADSSAAAGDAGSTDAGADDVAACDPKKAPATVGGKRPAEVFVPKAWDGCKKWPLIILLHGYGASGSLQNAYLGVGARVDKHGFVLVLPDGTEAANGKRFWNATDFCCDFYKQGIDDVAYITGLIDEAKAKLSIDPSRIYLLGHSNGGFMSYRMACEKPELIAGVASLAGAVTNTESFCTPDRAVNVLQMHGTNDKTIKYAGTNQYPGAEVATSRWVGLNSCKGIPVTSAPIDYDPTVKGPETTRKVWSGCKEETNVTLWKMEKSGHIPLVNDAFRDAMLKHILAWRRTGK